MDGGCKNALLGIRKSLMSVIFLPVIMWPEMAAPILWASEIFGSFPMPIKFLVWGGGGGLGSFGEGG